MNYIAILLWSLVCILIIWLVLLPLAEGFDYFAPNGNIGSKYEPIICIIDVRPELKYYTLRAIDAWERELNKQGIYDYDYRIKLIDSKDITCNAIIGFGNVTEVWKETSTNLGAVMCWEDSKFKVIDNERKQTFGTRFCQAVINPDFDAGRYYYDTLVHETGHILGLGHRLPIETSSYPYVVLTDDIMIPQAALHKKITIESLDALQSMYNYSGWNGMVNGNYTIPHNNE